MSYYIHNLQFPFTNTILSFKELTCEQSYSLIRINNNFPASSENRTDYHIQLVNILKDCIYIINTIIRVYFDERG